MPQSVVPEEKYPSKVSAEFANETLAERTIRALTDEQGFRREQISVVEPGADDAGHDDVGHKVEPETRAIGTKVATNHIAWVTGGLLIGLALAWALVSAGPALARANPLMTYMALGLIFPMIGFFVATVISMRPDHDRVLYKTRAAARAGRWTVVVHCADSGEKARAKDAMDHSAQTL